MNKTKTVEQQVLRREILYSWYYYIKTNTQRRGTTSLLKLAAHIYRPLNPTDKPLIVHKDQVTADGVNQELRGAKDILHQSIQNPKVRGLRGPILFDKEAVAFLIEIGLEAIEELIILKEKQEDDKARTRERAILNEGDFEGNS